MHLGKCSLPGLRENCQELPSGMLGDLKIPGRQAVQGSGRRLERVKARRASKMKVDQLSSQENSLSVSPLSTTAPDTNFEIPQSASARLEDPATTPPPSREATNRILISPTLPNHKSFSPPCPAPKSRDCAKSPPRCWNVGGSAFDVTGALLLLLQSQQPLSEAPDQWRAWVRE